jgi:hypothetical protein
LAGNTIYKQKYQVHIIKEVSFNSNDKSNTKIGADLSPASSKGG